jgi:two-component system chemotaxis sensor kinase CheA
VSGDPELDQILADEIEERLAHLNAERAAESEVRAALHSLRGATAMAGHVELSIVLAQVSTRLRMGDAEALTTLRDVLSEAAMRLRDGKAPLPTRWPEPPPLFAALPLDARYRAEYVTSMQSRLSDFDAALALPDPGTGLDTAYRAVHGMKSEAAGMSDDAMAWFCHGLEGRLKEAPREGPGALSFLTQLARHRAVLGLLLEDPPRGLETLRALAERRPTSQRPGETFGPSGRSQSNAPAPAELRVPVAAVDRALERLAEIDTAQEELRALVELAYRGASRLRLLRSQLLDLPRRVSGEEGDLVSLVEEMARGLGSVAATSERGGFALRRTLAELGAGARDLNAELMGLRMTTAATLFERATRGIAEQAAPFGKSVELVTLGDDTQLLRPLSDKVLEALSQLVRNAVAHGIEPEAERERAGKPRSGRLELRAQRVAGRLRIEVSDDGRGVDIEALRRTARTLGMDPEQAVRLAPDEELLTLLALPGLTTQDEADLLAGRGVGLNLAHQTVLALGGSLTLQSRPEQGFTAALELPLAGIPTDLLWLRSGSTTFALPTQYARCVTSGGEHAPEIALSDLLQLGGEGSERTAIELSVHGVKPVRLGVDAVGAIESRVVHPVSGLVQRAGPYAGAVRRGDGSLRLVLDAPAVAARARARLHARGA